MKNFQKPFPTSTPFLLPLLFSAKDRKEGMLSPVQGQPHVEDRRPCGLFYKPFFGSALEIEDAQRVPTTSTDGGQIRSDKPWLLFIAGGGRGSDPHQRTHGSLAAAAAIAFQLNRWLSFARCLLDPVH